MEQYGKLPPQAVELEESILGSCMIYENAFTEISLKINPESFYKEAHQKIYSTIKKLDNDGITIDMLSVTQLLKESGELESVGGGYYIAQLTNKATSNNDFNAEVIKQKYIARELIRITTAIQEKAFDDNEDVKDILDYNEALMTNLYDHISSSNRMNHISEQSKQAMDELEIRAKKFKSGGIMGIPTPLTELNNITQGWQNNNLIILAGRPAMGKTAFSLAFAKEAAINKHSVCIFSLEMSSIRLVDRIISSHADVEPDRYKKGDLNDYEWKRIEKANNEISNLPIYLDDSPYVSLNHIKSVSRMKHKSGECDLIIIDYLQLISSEASKYNREQEVSNMSKGLKGLAKELNIPIILLCQLNRSVETRGGDKRPQLSDLRESGAIEQDADVVMFPFRPFYYNMEVHLSDGTVAGSDYGELLIRKNREGSASADIAFWHNKNITKIKDYRLNNDFDNKEETPVSNNDDLTPNNEFDTEPF